MKQLIDRRFLRQEILKDPRKLVGVALATLACFYMGHEIPRHFLFSFTDSVGHRLFFVQRHFDVDSLKKGDYVVFSIYSSHIANCNPCSLIKRIGCLSGEGLRSTPAGAYYCGEKFLGLAKPYTLKGKRLERFVFNGPVPEGLLFLVGSHKDSYDSRYFGFIERYRIQARALPLWL